MNLSLLCLQIQGWQPILGRELYKQTLVGVRFNPWPGFPATVQILARPPGGGLSASLGQRLTCTLQTECHLGDRIIETSLSASLWAVTQRTNSSLHSSPNARGIAGEKKSGRLPSRSFGYLVSDNLYSLTQTPLSLRLSPGHKLR